MDIPQDLLDRALALDEAGRAELVQRLMRSPAVEPEEEREPGYEESWAEELERRVQEFEVDPSVAIPLDEAVESIRRDLGLQE
jgi:putative addiction module component (TIGR02574 family)